MYALGSGRTCGNCHVSPTYQDRAGWFNPDLPERKCNLSCVACHVSPSGGGLRNTSGRYYGQSSLSMTSLQERSYSDLDREILPTRWVAAYRRTFGDPSPDPRGKSIPSRFEDVRSDQTGGLLSFGKPLGGPSEYALWDGRYGELNADPLLQLGLDDRFAYWSGSRNVFPMQLDVHLALHPVEHLTLMGTLAARGRVAGFEAIAAEPLPVFARNAFVMAHELPYMTWARAGIFIPAFGTYLDDHTSFIRQYFDLDVSRSDSSVLGFEVGLAPNYPFASVSVFKNFTPAGSAELLDGGGGALALGWRDLAWSATAHVMLRRREAVFGGDLDAGGVTWGFSPFALSDALPFTLMGELSAGRREDLFGRRTTVAALYQEVWWLAANGLTVRAKYDLGSRDLGGPGALEHRFSLGLDLSPVPGLSFLIQGRYLASGPSTASGQDLFVTAHVWL